MTPRALVVACAVTTMLAGSCRSDPGPDREAAIRQVVDRGSGRFTRQQGECYVDKVTAELGAALLAPEATPTPAQLDRLTVIRIDCAGVASLGQSSDTQKPLRASDLQSGRHDPMHQGDNVQLDVLWGACEQGSGEACDQLFDASPVGSDYEEFASSCGRRSKELRCADRYARRAASGTTLIPRR